VKLSVYKQLDQCVSCESSNLKSYLETKDYFLTQEEFKLVKCEDCGLILTSPVPSQAEIGKYYNSPEYLSHNSSRKNATSILYNSLRKINIKRKFKLINSLSSGKSILDYGCGSGQLLQYFKEKDWYITGVEPNEEARNIASQLTETSILNNQEFELLPKNSFDVITLWHVLEHVHNLNLVLNKLVSLLNDNGILIIAVPNISSPDAKKYGKYWAGLDVPRHLYHFSAESMKHLLANHSMKVFQMVPMKMDAFYVSLLSEKYKSKKLPYFKALSSGFNSNLEAKKTNNYSSMIFVARRK